MIRRSLFLVLGLLPCSLACGPVGPSTPGTQGELGNGQFFYACDSDSDPVCDSDSSPGSNHTIPKSVAVGARFSASYTPSASSAENQGSATVMPASEELLVATETFGSSFKALKPGLAGLIARRGQTLVDLVHIRLAAVDHVQIDADTDPPKEKVSSLDVAVGESVRVRGISVDSADETLAGALSCTWTVDDDKIAAMTTLGSDNAVTIEGVAAGTTVLHLELGEMKAEVALSIGSGGSGGDGGSGGSGNGGSGGQGGPAGGGGQ